MTDQNFVNILKSKLRLGFCLYLLTFLRFVIRVINPIKPGNGGLGGGGGGGRSFLPATNLNLNYF